MKIEQHTRFWRFIGGMKMLGKPTRRGKLPTLRQVLHTLLRGRLQGPVRRVRSVPPGAFRTAWGWHRIRQAWPNQRKTVDSAAFDRLMRREGGEPPRPEDTL
jgi:hypothetical protein